ncbi:DUF4158 domain-containing protein [Nonomuraea sp. NPDC049504]|uniref:DUF4158 domain-containing protein n=1 Tax=Nonomuraea sp. NPDC049504 TaxID=3154729 RepID=UPI00343961BE
MLKFFELEARFPRREDVPRPAVEFMAGQVKVDAQLFAVYDWSGRTIKNHRAQIREFHGFREPTVGDEDKLADWLATKICPVEMSRDRLRGALPRRQDRTAEDYPDRTHARRGRGDVRAELHRHDHGAFVVRVGRQARRGDRRRSFLGRRPGRRRGGPGRRAGSDHQWR